MPSANLNQAVATAVQARTINNGQSCIAAKRFILHREIADEFEERFVERMAALKLGDPLDENTDIGPLATEDVAASLQPWVDRTVVTLSYCWVANGPIPRGFSLFQRS